MCKQTLSECNSYTRLIGVENYDFFQACDGFTQYIFSECVNNVW